MVLEPFPTDTRQEARYTLGRSPVHHMANTFTANSESPTNLRSLSLDSGRKPVGVPRENLSGTGRTCPTEKAQAGSEIGTQKLVALK